MNKKVAAILLSWAFMLSFIVLVIQIIPIVEAPTTWYVDDVPGNGAPGNPPEDFISIQEAIDTAQPGDTVIVYGGTYYENVIINKTINLIGEDRDYTIINGGDNGHVVHINADWVNVTGFTITGSGPGGVCGIYAYETNYTNIFNNNVSNNSWGICTWGFHNIISNNTLFSNYGWAAIWIGANHNLIANNTLFSNYVDPDGGSIVLEGSNNNTITNNNVINNQRGIYIWFSSGNIIKENYCSHNIDSGIYMEYVSKVIPCEFNIVVNNTFSYNGYGIYLDPASGTNKLYHNNIINNTNQAYDNSNNQWDNGYPSGGNYWSDYVGSDDFKGPDQNISGSDGIGDTNYSIDSDSQDNYPLMSPTRNFIYLFRGWNFISIPYIQSDTSLDMVLNSIKDSYDTVWWYNTSDNQDHWKVNSTLKPIHMNDLYNLDHKMGFWIHITKPGGVLFEYNGIQPSENQSIPIYPGWNYVGYPSLSNKNRTSALNNIIFDKDIDAIWTYNSATYRWESIDEADHFEVGRGYRIHSNTKKTWIVPL